MDRRSQASSLKLKTTWGCKQLLNFHFPLQTLSSIDHLMMNPCVSLWGPQPSSQVQAWPVDFSFWSFLPQTSAQISLIHLSSCYHCGQTRFLQIYLKIGFQMSWHSNHSDCCQSMHYLRRICQTLTRSKYFHLKNHNPRCVLQAFSLSLA